MTEHQDSLKNNYGRAIVRGEASFWTGDGKPDWLPDDVPYQAWVGKPFGWISEPPGVCWLRYNNKFRFPLPDYQFVYDALDRGFKPWFGSPDDIEPSDYEGGEVLFRDGETSSEMNHIWMWTPKSSPETDIIGYKPSTSALAGEPVRKQRVAEAEGAQQNETDGAESGWPASINPYAHADGWRECRPVADREMIHTGYADLKDEEPVAGASGSTGDNAFCAAVWAALKGDHTDLRREALILAAHRKTSFDPSTHVAVRKMTEAEAAALCPYSALTAARGYWMEGLSDLDIIIPDSIAKFCAETGHDEEAIRAWEKRNKLAGVGGGHG